MGAKGSKVSSITNIAVNLPAGLMAFVMKLALTKGKLPREIMRSASGNVIFSIYFSLANHPNKYQSFLSLIQ